MFDVEHEVSVRVAPVATRAPRLLRRALADFFEGRDGLNRMGQEYLPDSCPKTGRGNLPSVVSITYNFQAESRLHDGARMALPHIFDQTWPDPSKLGSDSKSAALLLNEAKETFASQLGVRSDEIHFLGEPNLGFHLGILGLKQENQTFKYGATDRMATFVIASSLSQSEELPSDQFGQIDYSSVGSSDLVALQLCNRETGVIQKNLPTNYGACFIDATACGTRIPLPENWGVALWDSRSWMGPAGVGLLAISKKARWKNPLPHLDGKISPGPASLPLIITSAIAIDSWVADEKNLSAKTEEISKQIKTYLNSQISGCKVIDGQAPHLISAIFDGVDSEHLITRMADLGFGVDAGSACSAANMKPSHVLAGMGLSTTGNIRLTIHHATTFEDVSALLTALKSVVTELRN